jgi:hypothetical protein
VIVRRVKKGECNAGVREAREDPTKTAIQTEGTHIPNNFLKMTPSNMQRGIEAVKTNWLIKATTSRRTNLLKLVMIIPKEYLFTVFNPAIKVDKIS